MDKIGKLKNERMHVYRNKIKGQDQKLLQRKKIVIEIVTNKLGGACRVIKRWEMTKRYETK